MSSISELSESASAPTSAEVAPLALSTVKLRYPRLFREYGYLSERQTGIDESMGDSWKRSPVDRDTGLCTTIFYQDFAAPLGLEGEAAGCPLKANSDANRFAIFVLRCLSASESGSCGGDACRQFGVLNAALDDAFAFISARDRFSHLLGWTCAAVSHGMYSMMSRYDPDGIRSLFVAAAAEWKKIYEKIPEGGDDPAGVSADLRIFAIRICQDLQKLLRLYKKEWKDHFEGVTLSFNFIRIPRPKKVPTAPAAIGIASSTSSLTPVPSTAAVPVTAAATATSVEGGDNGKKNTVKLPPPTNLFSSTSNGTAKETVEITVVRTTADHPLGLHIVADGNAVKVESINAQSLFLGTQLTAGMSLETINGRGYATFAEGVELIKNSVGKMTVVASFPRPALAAPMPAKSQCDPDAPKPSAESEPVSDVAKRKAPPEATYDSSIAKVAKKAVGDDEITMNPHAAFFSKLEDVARLYGPETGHILVRGISTGSDDSDDEEEEEEDEDTSKYTAEQMSTLRLVLINQKRQDRLDEMRKFLLGDQADCGLMMFNTSYSYEVLGGFDRFKSYMYPKAKSPADKFDLLFAYTHSLWQYDVWMHDNEGDMGGMVKSLAGMWKKLLKNDDGKLNIDSQYTRPGVEEFLRHFKEKIEDIDMDPYPAFKFNFQ